MQQAEMFPEDPQRPTPTREPASKVKAPKHHSTSLCSYCGQRVPGWTMRSTPAADDSQRWIAITPYHAEGCRWIRSRGNRRTEA